MYNKVVLAPGIILYKTDKSKADMIKNQLEETIGSRWNQALAVDPETHENISSMSRKCFDYAVGSDVLNSTDLPLKKLYTDIDEWISRAFEDYTSTYMIEKVVPGPYIFLKYNFSDKFDFHIDDGKKYPRTVSVSAYLNEDYSGGEIEFNHFNIKHKPESGDIIFFSSSYPYMHRVHPVESGTRYAVVNWYRYQGYPSVME